MSRNSFRNPPGFIRGEVQILLNKQGSSTEFAYLDDYASILLLTHMRSIGVVTKFKKTLVQLDVYDTRLLAAIRNHDTLLLTRHLKQKERKQLLDDFVAQYRIKHPRLKLAPTPE